MASLLAKKAVLISKSCFNPRLSVGLMKYSEKTIPIYDPAEGKEGTWCCNQRVTCRWKEEIIIKKITSSTTTTTTSAAALLGTGSSSKLLLLPVPLLLLQQKLNLLIIVNKKAYFFIILFYHLHFIHPPTSDNQ